MANQPDVALITNAGLTVYWVTFGLMIGSAVGFAIMTWLRPFHDRKHGYMILMVVLIASGAYYAMAAQGGVVNIGRPSSHTKTQDPTQSTAAGTTTGNATRFRSIYYARYIDWVFTTPLLLLDLLIMASVPVAVATWVVVADIMMIVIGLFAALSSHSPRWGFYGVSCFFEVVIGYGLLVPGIKYAFLRGKALGSFYTLLASILFITWWGYPIVWGFAEGANFISVDAEVACYAGLDIVAKVIFGWILCLGHPVISRTEEAERKEGKYLPSIMAAPCNAPLYSVFTSGPGFPGGYAPTATRETELAPTTAAAPAPVPSAAPSTRSAAPAPAPVVSKPNGTAPTLNPVATYDDTAVSNVVSTGRLGHNDPALPVPVAGQAVAGTHGVHGIHTPGAYPATAAAGPYPAGVHPATSGPLGPPTAGGISNTARI